MIRGCGTHTGYRNGCRCDSCRLAQRTQRTKLRRAKGIGSKKPAEHGTVGKYTNHACRCDPCTEAQRVYIHEYRNAVQP